MIASKTFEQIKALPTELSKEEVSELIRTLPQIPLWKQIIHKLHLNLIFMISTIAFILTSTIIIFFPDKIDSPALVMPNSQKTYESKVAGQLTNKKNETTLLGKAIDLSALREATLSKNSHIHLAKIATIAPTVISNRRFDLPMPSVEFKPVSANAPINTKSVASTLTDNFEWTPSADPTVSGKWTGYMENGQLCLTFDSFEKGKKWKATWKLRECFDKNEWSKSENNNQLPISLQRDAGTVNLYGNIKQLQGSYEFIPSVSYRNTLREKGADLDQVEYEQISFSGSSKRTGRGKLIITNKPKEITWFRFFSFRYWTRLYSVFRG